MILDWNSIRPLNGGRDKGFEELCAQLARAESPAGARFERKGTPDAGVECLAVLSDGSEWGWQAKYFDALGDSQWSQLDKSVKTAIEKHPRLVRYFICTPLDRSDARTPRQKSAKDKWDERVERWTRKAALRGMAVEFVFWGSHELLERLTHPKHVGRVQFWFNVRGFDDGWFTARLEEARRTAGTRYTPEVHIDLPIALELEAFGRTDRFFEREKSRARTIRESLRILESFMDAADTTVGEAMASVSVGVQVVLALMKSVGAEPIGPLPFKAIAEKVRIAEGAAEELSRILYERELEFDANSEAILEKGAYPSYRNNPFRDRQFRLSRLTSDLRTVGESLDHADCIASGTLMLLCGAAGSGKTHLLCDVARQRVASGRPTVLLMGQRFVGTDAPWSQALQQLDLAALSAEEFVGALEAAAQASGSRALLIVDAMNEGAGRIVWPSHLEAFLAHLERSPWIGVVLAVRSAYLKIIVAADVQKRAATVTHQGFAEHEYDATRSFFVHYGLEFPSTPLLAPEFRNPLFLKTLCQGLQKKGERRLPRGFQGVTAVFDLFLDAVNKHLALSLGFDKRIPLVRQALEAVTGAVLDSGEKWLTLAKAAGIVDALLPGREFERSLYRGLVVEGVLIEEATRQHAEGAEEGVFVCYERFADYLAAKTLLDRHLDLLDPASAFADGGPLAFLCDEKKYVSPGLLEALCIQIPERTGKELISLAPTCAKRWWLADAFRQSLVWRAYAAFSDDTRDALNKLCRSDHDLSDSIDALLTVATLPGHPMNAHFLDRQLRRDAMPDRDAWWSVYLHHAWGTRGAADRIADWASSVDANTAIDDEAIDLCAIALTWMLTTSNRFLRDRATKALVSLLTGRLVAMVRLVERFADIDDPYVAERVYAVAYGVAMRSHDRVSVGGLAACVYDRVFESQSPPPHILLRDYARGVVERALHLGSAIDVVADRIRPPYKSSWPAIPTDEEIKPLLPEWSKSSDSAEFEWGRNRIGSSVMSDDFARYVIGATNDWLSLTLDAPPWKRPPRPKDQMRLLVGEFSDDERKAWEEYGPAVEEFVASRLFVSFRIALGEKNETSEGLGQLDLSPLRRLETARCAAERELEDIRVVAVAALDRVLTNDHAKRLREILSASETEDEARRPPRLDLRQIQRYVLNRVFDLGWTKERFERFDRCSIGHRGREAAKAERIGKKYQWIAYHEILAFVSDRFQYLEQFREEEGDQAYQGPWQDRLRDIDPSCTIRSLRGGTSREGHVSAWWGATPYDAWEGSRAPRDWVQRDDDLPKVEELLMTTNPADGSRWINGYGHFSWRQPTSSDLDSSDVERRELWYSCTGYLIRVGDVQSFLTWADRVDFWSGWMPEAANVYRMFLGEHAWAPVSRYFQKPYFGDEGWTQPDHDCPVGVQAMALKYLSEASGFDCSVDESFTLCLPASALVSGLGIRWSGRGVDFVDASDRVAVQDPTAHADDPSALLFREDLLREFLAREKLTICWAVRGEKQVLSAGFGTGPHHPWLQISGAYVLSESGLLGFTNPVLHEPESEE